MNNFKACTFAASKILIKEELLEFARMDKIKECLGYPASGPQPHKILTSLN